MGGNGERTGENGVQIHGNGCSKKNLGSINGQGKVAKVENLLTDAPSIEHKISSFTVVQAP